ncbi:MAG TPA: hypothetical protein VJB82_03245 [Candidatus Peribacterales bacterium]|nr:hypothetical protein [Candidatus Peribacterales bacterium]
MVEQRNQSMFERLKSRVDSEVLVRAAVIPTIVALFTFVIYMATRSSNSPSASDADEENPVVTKPGGDSQNPAYKGHSDVHSSLWVDTDLDNANNQFDPVMSKILSYSPEEKRFYESLEGLSNEEQRRRLKEHDGELEEKMKQIKKEKQKNLP